MSGALHGKVAVVTGGGRGLGLAIARAYVDAGASVVIAGRDARTLDEACAALGPAAAACATDVSSEASVQALERFVQERFGRAEILVNNAGINPRYQASERTGLEEWNAIVATNLTGVFLCCRTFGAGMLARGAGSIVNVSSIAGRVGLPKTAAYCAAKGGVEQLTKALAVEWAAKGVRVNAIAPGYFETDLTAGMREHPVLADRLRGRTPMGRFGRPEEIAGLAVLLASDASGYVTGQSYGIDGGWTAA